MGIGGFAVCARRQFLCSPCPNRKKWRPWQHLISGKRINIQIPKRIVTGKEGLCELYDHSSLFLRARPPTDPFHAVFHAWEHRLWGLKEPPETPAGGNAGGGRVQAEPVHTTEEEIPRLAGVLLPWERISGAILTYKGTTRTLKKGE